MKPYYSEAGIEIYHGDCREILPSLPKVDLVLTDPPYGMHYVHGRTSDRKGNSRHHGIAIEGDDQPFVPSLWLTFPDQVFWGANNFASRLPDSRGWLVWNKRPAMRVNDFSDCELAWTSLDMPTRYFRHRWNGVLRESQNGEIVLHPSEKPVALMRWCLSLFPDANVTLDPFMGSGTTLRAAKDIGRKAIGIEINEDYCRIAVERLRQDVLPLRPAEEPQNDGNHVLF